MKILIVSCAWPGNAEESSHGVFRRFDMLAEAVCRIASEVEALFYVPQAIIDGLGDDRAAASQRLSLRWGMPVKVRLCARIDTPPVRNAWQMYGEPALSLLNQHPYNETAGPVQRQALEQALAGRPDAVLVHRLRSMPPFLGLVQALPPVIFDLDDLEHLAYERSLAQPPHWRGKPLLRLRLPALRRGQARAVRLATQTLVCSQGDRQALLEDAAAGTVVVVPNAISLPDMPPLSHAPTLLSVGQYAYGPNRQGIEYFLDQVWPRLLARRSDLRLVVAGPNPQCIRHASAPPPGVSFPGFVDDISTLYTEARIVICPILSGSGTRVKLVEAAAWGRPIVSTTIGAEGLDMVDGVHALLRDDPATTAQACLDLLDDDALATTLADGGRRLAQERFDRRTVVRQLADLFSQLTATSRPA
jgi:glycosyltransferase involved in cell wall biosynthesis